MPEVQVPAERVVRWVANVGARHGAPDLSVGDGALCGTCPDGTTFALCLPFDTTYAGSPAAEPFAGAVVDVVPDDWGVLLVRKGGYAVARCGGSRIVASKVGRRHVQGRTKAGGQSQQRFARRRDNQARDAYRAAADHAARLLTGPQVVVTGGDRTAVTQVLADPRLARLAVVGGWLDVPEPRRDVLEQAVADAVSARADIREPQPA